MPLKQLFVGIGIAIAGIFAFLFQRNKSKISELERKNDDLSNKIDSLDKINAEFAENMQNLQQIQEQKDDLHNETENKIEGMFCHADDSDSFSASIDILHDIASRKKRTD